MDVEQENRRFNQLCGAALVLALLMAPAAVIEVRTPGIEPFDRYVRRDVVELDTGWSWWSTTYWDECVDGGQGRLVCYSHRWVKGTLFSVRDEESRTEYSPTGWSTKKLVPNPYNRRVNERILHQVGWR